MSELLAGFKSPAWSGVDDSRRGRDWTRACKMSIEQVRSREQSPYHTVLRRPIYTGLQTEPRSCMLSSRFITRNDIKTPFLIEKVSTVHISHDAKFLSALKYPLRLKCERYVKRFNFFTNFYFYMNLYKSQTQR